MAGEYLGPRLFDLMNAMGSRPNTLTHNDLHLGNLLLRGRGINLIPVIIDWQLTAYAGATNDLAKFMMTTVPFEMLAEYELALVKHYVQRLQAMEVVDYSFDECLRDYRRAQVMVFGNYAIGSAERSSDRRLTCPTGESIGDSTRRVVEALSLVDPYELSAVLP
jgi:aminoglycoside phosphotransferase (APT) family kinase protein